MLRTNGESREQRIWAGSRVHGLGERTLTLHVERHRHARKLGEQAEVDHRLRVGRLLQRLRAVVDVPVGGAAALAVHQLAVDVQTDGVGQRDVHG